MKPVLLCDLDGVLVDPAPAIAGAAARLAA